MSLNGNALTSLATAKSYLKIPDSEHSEDSIVELFINSSSEWLERECDRKFISASFTEYRSGRKQNILVLKQFPVTAISDLRVDNSAVFGTDAVIPSTEYALGDDGNSLVLLNTVFQNGYNNIKVVYTAGFATIPSDLEHACLWLVSYYRRMRDGQDIGRKRKSRGDESEEIMQSAPDDIVACVMRYKRTEIPLLESSIRNF